MEARDGENEEAATGRSLRNMGFGAHMRGRQRRRGGGEGAEPAQASSGKQAEPAPQRCFHRLAGLPQSPPFSQTCCWLPDAVSLSTAAAAGEAAAAAAAANVEETGYEETEEGGGDEDAGVVVPSSLNVSLPSYWWHIAQPEDGSAPEGEVAYSRHCLPSFIIAGTQKSGSTALAAILERHPAVRMSIRKELHYFDTPKSVRRGLPFYSGFFPSIDAPEYIRPGDPPPPPLPPPDANGNREVYGDAFLTGEATPYYLASRDACRNIAAMAPDARLIVLAREPVDRAYSEYQMKSRRVDDQSAFLQVIADHAGTIHDCFLTTARPARGEDGEPTSGGVLTLDHLQRMKECAGSVAREPKWNEFIRPLFERMAIVARQSAIAAEEKEKKEKEAAGGGGGEQLPQRRRALASEPFFWKDIEGDNEKDWDAAGGSDPAGDASRSRSGSGAATAFAKVLGGAAEADPGAEEEGAASRPRRRLSNKLISPLESRARAVTAVNVMAKCFPPKDGQKEGDPGSERGGMRPGGRRLVTVMRDGRLVPSAVRRHYPGAASNGAAAQPEKVLTPPRLGLVRNFNTRCYLHFERLQDLAQVMLKEVQTLRRCFENATGGGLEDAFALPTGVQLVATASGPLVAGEVGATIGAPGGWRSDVRAQELLERMDFALDSCMKPTAGIADQYLYRGLYALQLHHCARYVSPDRILVIDANELRDRPQEVMDAIHGFIGLPEFQYEHIGSDAIAKQLAEKYPDFEVRTGWRLNSQYKEMPQQLRDELRRFYHPHNELLYGALGKKMPGWPQPWG